LWNLQEGDTGNLERSLMAKNKDDTTEDQQADEKPLILLHGEIKTPPFTAKGRREAGWLLGQLQQGLTPVFPQARPMPSIGPRCGELRVRDAEHNWRIIYRVDSDAVLVAEVFPKKTGTTPRHVIEACKERFRHYDKTVREAAKQAAKGPRVR
jgi:phage-related protein